MYIYQLKIKLKATDASAAALKILRAHCPVLPLGNCGIKYGTMRPCMLPICSTMENGKP